MLSLVSGNTLESPAFEIYRRRRTASPDTLLTMYGAYPSVSRSLGVGERPPGFLGVVKGDRLLPGQQLNLGDELHASNGEGRLVLQAQDGNLVIYAKAGNAIWNSGTINKGAVRAVMQTDGNFVVYTKSNVPLFQTGTNGRYGAFIVLQTDGNLVVYVGTHFFWQAHTTGWTPPNKSGGIIQAIEHLVDAPVQTVVRAATGNQSLVVTGVSVAKVPVLGDVINIVGEATLAPFKLADSIASGQRLDHALVGALKDQLKIIKDVAPYAQMVVSVIPGLGTGVAMAVGAGMALAEGQSITEATKAAIRSALPGGPLVQAGFDAALKVAAGENIGKVALEGVRSQLPAEAQKAFDIGLAVATGEKLQTALAKGLASIGTGQLKEIVASGQKAISSIPSLSNALKSVTPGAATQGFQIAAGLLSHAGVGEKALAAARNALPADVRAGFDVALKTQEPHVAWLANITNPPAGRAPAPLEPPKRATAPVQAAPQPLEPPKRAAAPASAAKAPQALEPPKKRAPGAVVTYGPYPPRVGLSAPPPWNGALWGCGTVDTEDVWGPPITNMPQHMEWAGRSAVHGSKGRPRKVRGPNGTTYLFAIENGTLTARPSIAV
jgi:hypothetical protein